MNKTILLLLVSIICLSCSSMKDLTLGSKFRGTKASNGFIFIPNGSFINAFPVVMNNIEYKVGFLNNTIIYIYTDDKNFTINNLKINDKLPESYNNREFVSIPAYNNREIGYIPGWGYYIEIESGWYAGFDSKTKPNEESRIEWFFKYNF